MSFEAYCSKRCCLHLRYSHEWEKTVKRSGRWIDFENDYKTLNMEFMETVWWVFSQISKKGLVYRGMKVIADSFCGSLSCLHCVNWMPSTVWHSGLFFTPHDSNMASLFCSTRYPIRMHHINSSIRSLIQ